jgi:hypothetical protein
LVEEFVDHAQLDAERGPQVATDPRHDPALVRATTAADQRLEQPAVDWHCGI